MVWWFFGKRGGNNADSEELQRLKTSLKDSFSNVKQDIGAIGDWIRVFKEKDKEYERRFKEMDRQLRVLQGMMEYQMGKKREDLDERSIVHERVQSFNRSNQSFMNVQRGVQSMKSIGKRLTPMQKKVVALLSIAKKPLSYETIAGELKINLITVRRHINDIKRAGLNVKEKISVDNKRKVFFIEDQIKQKIMARNR